jgi:hypothetical protein
MTNVVLHIGLPKTGTTSIQRSLEKTAGSLADKGVLFPGGAHLVQRRAVYDLVGRRIPGDDPAELVGSWSRLVEEIQSWDGPCAVVSEELLGLARPRQVARIVRDLAGHRVSVVLGLRNIGSLVPSTWQQEIRKGRSFTWDEYMASVRDPTSGPATAGTAFWMRQDPMGILDVWEKHVAREHFRLVTVPNGSSPASELLERFGDAAGIASDLLEPVTVGNPSLGVVETEVLRRLNLGLAAKASRRDHLDLVNRGILPGFTGQPSRPLRLPHDELPWATLYTKGLTTELERRGYAVSGTLEDLAPRAAAPGERRIDDVDDVELLTATEAALQGLSRRYTRARRRQGSADQRSSSTVGLRERAVSSSRARSFGLRVAALERADDSRLLRWLSRRQIGGRGAR